MRGLLREHLLKRLPDGPATVQLRALLELGETQLFGTREGAAFAHAEAGLGALHGQPTTETMAEFTLACGWPPELLAQAPVELAGYTWARAGLSTLPAGRLLTPTLSSGGGEGARLTPELWPRVPHELSATLANAMERRAVFCASVDERPVSFAWAPLRSEAWFDLHVHTLPAFREQGLGLKVAASVIRHERSEGRAPVWGAAASDEAAVALGRALGFVACGQTLWKATKRV